MGVVLEGSEGVCVTSPMSMMGDTTWVWFWKGGCVCNLPYYSIHPLHVVPIVIWTHPLDAGEQGLEPAGGHLTVTVQERQNGPHSRYRSPHSGLHQTTALLHAHQTHLRYGSQQSTIGGWGERE